MALKIKVSERQLNEMARVGKIGEFEIQVWNREGGEVPHVHIYNDEPRGKNTGLDACVQLEKSMYFPHGKHTGTMNASQRKEFNEFMHRPHRTGKFASNYEYAVFLWNDNNSSHEIELKLDANGEVIIPDYSEIAKYVPNRDK